MLEGWAASGNLGAHYARRMNPKLVRGVIVAVGVLTTVVFYRR